MKKQKPAIWLGQFIEREVLDQVDPGLDQPRRFVLTSADGALARLAVADLATATGATATAPILVLESGTDAWAKAGLPIETGASHMASEPVDVVLSVRANAAWAARLRCASTSPRRSTSSIRLPKTTTSVSGWSRGDWCALKCREGGGVGLPRNVQDE